MSRDTLFGTLANGIYIARRKSAGLQAPCGFLCTFKRSEMSCRCLQGKQQDPDEEVHDTSGEDKLSGSTEDKDINEGGRGSYDTIGGEP